MSTKLYFQKGDAICYPKAHHLRFMKKNNISEMEVFEAEREVGNGYFYCHKFQEIGESKEGSCGSSCEGYNPRNGKSGCCKHRNYTYEQTDKILLLKITKP